MATHHIHRQKKGGLGEAFYKASNIAGSYRPEPEPAAPASAKSKPRHWLLSRKPSSSRLEIKQVNSEERIGVAAEEGGGGGRRGVTVEGARRSVSQVETNLPSVVAFLQVKVMVTDMPGFMQVHAFRCARRTYDSLEKFSSKNMAFNIKKEFDKVYGPAWHCIVGSSYGSFVTHATGCFLYFSMEKLYVLLFKTSVQRALH